MLTQIYKSNDIRDFRVKIGLKYLTMDPVAKKADLESKYYPLLEDIKKIKSPPIQDDFLVCTMFEQIRYKDPDGHETRVFEQFLKYG